MCYRGHTELQLEAKSYGLIARRKDNIDSSNWNGKSAILEAIHFALTGALNSDRRGGVDGWITEGESIGGVEIELDNGAVIRRAREGTTRIELDFEDRHLSKEEAQSKIDSMIGLSSEEFLSTFYFKQRAMSRLVLAEPGERMTLVRQWFNLEPLERAESFLRRQLSDMTETYNKGRSRLSIFKERLLEFNIEQPSWVVSLSDEQLMDEETSTDKTLAELIQMRSELASEIEKASEINKGISALGIYSDIVKRGTRLAEEMSQVDIEAMRTHEAKFSNDVQEAIASFVVADRQSNSDKQLVKSGFSGLCPVMGAPCFVPDQVRSACQAWEGKFAESQKIRDRTLIDRDAIVALDRVNRNKLAQVEHKRAELIKLRSDALKMKPAGDLPDELIDIGDLLSKQKQINQVIIDHTVSLKSIREYRREKVRIKADIARTTNEIEALYKKIEISKAAIDVLGRNGVQRRIAEQCLNEITFDANDILSESGVDLKVDLTWTREGSGLAKTCDRCGNAYPTSARIKDCSRCGASRGANIIHSLEIGLSDRSGAAEDLAGIAIQLSVSKYIRGVRGSDWGTMLIDEPFGALDRNNRRSLTRALQSMMSSFGVEQSFIVSHSDDTRVFPGTILIERDGKESTVQVIALCPLNKKVTRGSVR